LLKQNLPLHKNTNRQKKKNYQMKN